VERVGIDIGSNFLKMVRLRVQNGRYCLTDLFSLKIGSQEINGREAIREEQLQDIIRGRIERSGFGKVKGTVGISGRDVLHRFIHIPPVPPWKVEMMVDFEVHQHAGTGEEEIAYDNLLLDLPKGLSQEYTVLTSMAKGPVLETFLAALARAGIQARAICPSPVAAFNAFTADLSRVEDKTVLLVDVGAFNTELVILCEKKLYFVRTLPIGGRIFTEAIKEELDVTMERAEEIKCERGIILLDGEEEADGEAVKISGALKRAALQLSSQIQASVRFAATNIRLENLSVDAYYFSGGGARVRGLLEYWQSMLKKPVHILNPLKSFDLSRFPPARVKDLIELPSSYTVALGLALADAGGAAVSMNLMPEKEKKRITFLHRKLPLYASLIVFFVSSVLFTLFTVTVRREIEEISNHVTAVTRAVERKEKAFDAAVREADAVVEKYRFITSRALQSDFLLRVVDWFNRCRPRQVWVTRLETKGGAGGGLRVEMTVCARESEKENAYEVFKRFSSGMRKCPVVRSIKEGDVEDYTATEKKMLVVPLTVYPTSAYCSGTGRVAE